MKMQILDLQFIVHLGVSEKERNQPQPVFITLQIDFAPNNIPKACETDMIEDTICYFELTELLRQVVQKKYYGTLEHLTQSCFNTIKSKISSDHIISLTVHKKFPELGVENQGVKITLSNFQSQQLHYSK